MKNASLLFLTFLYLISVTELSQFVKLPFVLQHYQMHKQKKPQVTFTEFLASHYFESDLNAPDKNQHQQLLFKSFTNHVLVVQGLIRSTSLQIMSLEFSSNPKTILPSNLFIERTNQQCLTINILISGILS